MLQGSVSDIKADLGLCLLSAVNVCHPPLSTLNITLFYPPKKPKTKKQNTPKQTTKQTNQLLDTNSAVLSLPNPYQPGIAAFSLPQAGTEKNFVID